jgi:hypothetical protein
MDIGCYNRCLALRSVEIASGQEEKGFDGELVARKEGVRTSIERGYGSGQPVLDFISPK